MVSKDGLVTLAFCYLYCAIFLFMFWFVVTITATETMPVNSLLVLGIIQIVFCAGTLLIIGVVKD